MHFLTAIRLRHLRAPRLVAAIMALGWLGFAVAPCQAMPHQQPQGTSHHGSMPGGDCGHCSSEPAGLDNACAMVAAPDCQSVGQAILDPRDNEIPQPAVGPPPAIPGSDAYIPDVGPLQDIRAHRLPVPRASIQQRYCTYLN